MIKNNLFGKEDPDKREWHIKYSLNQRLKLIMKNAKKGYSSIVENDITKLKGMIFYALVTDDIDEETYNKINNLIQTIIKKYD